MYMCVYVCVCVCMCVYVCVCVHIYEACTAAEPKRARRVGVTLAAEGEQEEAERGEKAVKAGEAGGEGSGDALGESPLAAKEKEE